MTGRDECTSLLKDAVIEQYCQKNERNHEKKFLFCFHVFFSLRLVINGKSICSNSTHNIFEVVNCTIIRRVDYILSLMIVLLEKYVTRK